MARLDKYLAKLNGASGDIPAPVSTLDKEMQTLAENPPSGGGVTLLECTVTGTSQLDAVVSIPMTAGELYEVMQTNLVILKYDIPDFQDASTIHHFINCLIYADKKGNANYTFIGNVNMSEFTANSADAYPSSGD